MPLPDDSLERWSPGEPYSQALRAERLNAAPDAITDIRRVINRYREEQQDGIVAEDWIGKVVDKGPGPKDTADKTGAEYWVERQQLKSDLDLEDRLDVESELVVGVAKTVAATNIGEIPADNDAEETHTLPLGTLVHVFVVQWHRASGPVTKYYFEKSLGSLPPGTGRGKVLMLIDDLNPGTVDWEYPQFHPEP